MFRATFRRLLAINDPPERTALAFSVGVFIGFSPFLGLHTILATLIAFFFRFNKVAIYLGTYINNPILTLVPIILSSYAIGAFLLGRPLRIPPEGIELLKNPHLLTRSYYQQVFVNSRYIVEPFAIGATVLSVVCSLSAYPVTLWALRAHQRRKKQGPATLIAQGAVPFFQAAKAKNFMKQLKHYLFILIALGLGGRITYAQTNPAPGPSPAPSAPAPGPSQPGSGQQVRPTPFEIADYGVSFQADPRLIVIMAALDAAGFDPVPAGKEVSVFRARVRKDQAELNPTLRERLHSFYEHNKLPGTATLADQAARYVSLAYVLGPPPRLEAPERSEDLPAGVLEVLDFAPLVREFYRQSGIDERLVSYTRAYQSEGDRLKAPSTELVRLVLSYLHTRPITVSRERVLVRAPTAKKKGQNQAYVTREHDRHFYIVPDLLAAPGTTNLRVIADDYYAIVPEGTDPASSELRRAYLQFVIDPLILRFNKEIATRREDLRQLLKKRENEGETITPDIFIAVSRSLVAGADARLNELVRLRRLGAAVQDRLLKAKDEAARTAITNDAKAAIVAIQDETVADLAESYEHGSVLSFFFADQLKGIEESGFDIANFFPDMMASFDPAKEATRLAESATARGRVVAARQQRMAQRAEPDAPAYTSAEAAKMATLVQVLGEIEQTLRQRDYNGAESRLRELIKEYPREPRIFFALAQTASVAAADATDENVQAQRLNNALSNYRLAIEASTPETDRALISRAHEAMGRIHAFFDRKSEAASEFDAAIKIGNVTGGAYKDALEGKKKLEQPQ